MMATDSTRTIARISLQVVEDSASPACASARACSVATSQSAVRPAPALWSSRGSQWSSAMAESGPIRVLIVDDHPTLRAGLRAILETREDIIVVGEAANGAEALARAPAFRPDVVLMDLEMPGTDGVEAIRRLRDVYPAARVVVFTAFDTDDRIVAAVQAGAHGYLLKGAPRDEIFRAIEVVHGGGSLLQPAIATKRLDHLSARLPQHGSLDLTPREREVLELLVEGRTNREIAGRLVVTERTAKFHVASILEKLGVPNRAAAVRVAIERRL